MLTRRVSLHELSKQEKQSYEGLSALIDFIKGHQEHLNKLTATTDFDTYKRTVLTEATLITKRHQKKVSRITDTQFNVTHYQRAILSASQVNYRNMAILAALKDLTPTALNRLVMIIRKHCIKISRKVQTATDEKRKQQYRELAKRNQEAFAKSVIIAYSEPVESML